METFPHPASGSGSHVRGANAYMRGKSRRGMTIMEVMMASFVMLLAISASIVSMQHGFRALDTARKTTLASQIMQSEMERIRMLSWTRIQALPASEPVSLKDIFPQNTAAEIAAFGSLSKTFQVVRTVGNMADYDDEIREIGITITWTGIDGMLHTRTSSTQYSKDGLYAYYSRIP